MIFSRGMAFALLAAAGGGGGVWAQEALPPMQPPLPLAPPPPQEAIAPMIVSNSFEARVASEDVIAALKLRGFYELTADSSWSSASFACLASVPEDFWCAQNALVSLRDGGAEEAGRAVVLYGQLDGQSLAWTCIGVDRIVAVRIDLPEFFAVDVKVRNDMRNRALACLERAVGVYDWDRPHGLL